MRRARLSLFPRRVMRLLLQLPNKGLDYLERFAVPYTEGLLCRYPPIFIIGAPRSGSTLLYQVLVNRFEFGYLSNLHCYCYGAPSIAHSFIRHWWQQALPAPYESIHGQSKGLFAPSECGAFWQRFFRREPNYVPLEEADPQRMYRLRRAVCALSNAFGRSVLFKNLYCSMRLAPIADALPEALFIVIRRDEIDNAHSLLEGRQRVYGTSQAFWGVKPPNISCLNTLQPHEQVLEQIHQIYAQIKCDQSKIGNNRFTDVQYESFCADTQKTLAQLETFFTGNGVQVESRKGQEIPKSFPIRRTLRIDQEIYEKMKAYIKQRDDNQNTHTN